MPLRLGTCDQGAPNTQQHLMNAGGRAEQYVATPDRLTQLPGVDGLEKPMLINLVVQVRPHHSAPVEHDD